MLKVLLNEVVPLIENFAPVIANALGGFTNGVPWGIYLLSKAFGIHINEIDKLPQAIKEDPDSENKIKKVEDNFSEWFMENASQIFDDRAVKSIEVNFESK